MKVKITGVAIICLVAIGSCGSVLRARTGVLPQQNAAGSSDQSSRSVWDGVFTEEQAKRGKGLYAQECMMCHGASLTGGDGAAPLAGDVFLANWNDMTVDDLFERARLTMPLQDPGKLSRQEYVDLLTYILGFNKFPSGKTELANQSQILKQIRIVATRPTPEQAPDRSKSKSETK
jgi:quinoprotein glucose dehydrogenase